MPSDYPVLQTIVYFKGTNCSGVGSWSNAICSVHVCISHAPTLLPWCLQGKTLTNSVKQIFTDFQAAAEKFQKLNYDAMNVDEAQFADDFAVFCGVIRELERRLGAVITQVCVLFLQSKLLST